MNFEELLKEAKKAGIEEIELYERLNHNLAISFFDENVDQREESSTDVCAIRGVYNNQIATVYTEKNSTDSIPMLIKRLKEAASVITKDDPFFIYAGDEDYEKLPEKNSDFSEYSIAEKISLLKNIVKSLKNKTNYYYHAQVEYSEVWNEVRITNSNGLKLSKSAEYANVFANLICKKDEQMQEEYDYEFLNKLKSFDVDKFTTKIVDNTVSKFGASSIPSSTYKVVLQNEVVCSLLRVYQNVFSANAVKNKVSFLEGKLQTKVFGDNINIEDNPFLENAPVMSSFDDEGVATKKNIVVENGVLKTYLHNLSTAAFYNVKSTGNGYKQSVNSSVGVSFNNLCLKPGNSSFNQLLEEVNNGVLITDITGLHAGVNQISGDFNVQCNGYLIENGKRTKPVTLIILSGKFQDVFNNVKLLGNDTIYRSGIFAPSLYIEKMNISGK